MEGVPLNGRKLLIDNAMLFLIDNAMLFLIDNAGLCLNRFIVHSQFINKVCIFISMYTKYHSYGFSYPMIG